MDVEIRRQIVNNVVDQVGEGERGGVIRFVMGLPHN